MGEAFRKLHEFMTNNNSLRICILDNNNVQFCMHHKAYFPIEEIYKHYDLILVPSWVYVEIGESDRRLDRKSTRLNSSHVAISYAVFCLKKKKSLYMCYQ